jgi:hypothetical protein
MTTDVHGVVDEAEMSVGSTVDYPDLPDYVLDDQMHEGFVLAAEPFRCGGLNWPVRLWEVEADESDVKRESEQGDRHCFYFAEASRLTVISEQPAEDVFGPNGGHVVEFLARVRPLTDADLAAMDAMGEPGFTEFSPRWFTEGVVWAEKLYRATARAHQEIYGLLNDPPEWRRGSKALNNAVSALIARDHIQLGVYKSMKLAYCTVTGNLLHPDDDPIGQ